MKRRQFLRFAAVGAAAALASPRLRAAGATGKPGGANGDIRVGVAGIRAHGRTHLNAYKTMPGVRIVAICDVDAEALRARAAELEKDGIRVKTYRDQRAMFDDPEIDAVSLATPNHWHALGTVWACQAGKHVCVEKPVSHSVWEGRKMVEAARKYGRLVQADLNLRASPELAATAAFLQSGRLGPVDHIRCWNYVARGSLGRVQGPQKIPDHLDYDLWTGPAPWGPLLRKNLHYDWHWQWATGNGEIGNNGAHNLDLMRWMLGRPGLPRSVLGFGGRYGYVDDGQTPNTQTALYDFDGIPVIYESRALPEKSGSRHSDGFDGETATGRAVTRPHGTTERNNGQAIFCADGYLLDGTAYDNDGREIQRLTGQNGLELAPQTSFIAALRSGRPADLTTDILEGHLSACFSHLGNISFQCGEPRSFAEAAATVADTPHAAKAFARLSAHLAANGVDLAHETLTTGPRLTLDAATERFTGAHSAHANHFLKDNYREPFVIRDTV